jgi:N4-gp56 family major capsid protein
MPIQPYGPNLQLTTSPEVAKVIRDYWENDWLTLLREKILPFSNIGTPITIPKGSGNAVTIHDMPAIPVVDTNLTEGTTPDPVVPQIEPVQGTTAQRGMYVAMSDRAWNEAMLDYVQTVTNRVNINMLESVENYHYKQTCDTTNVFYGDGTVTSDATVTPAMTLSVATLRRLQRKLRSENVPTLEDGYWRLVISPASALAIESDPEWLAMSNADKNNSADAEKGVIGQLYNFKIIVTNVIATIQQSANPGNLADLSYNIAYGGTGFKRIKISGEPPEVILKDPGVLGGPLNQRGTIGWKGTLGSKVTQNPCVVRVVTADPA